jgi:hypothetical protein
LQTGKNRELPGGADRNVFLVVFLAPMQPANTVADVSDIV